MQPESACFLQVGLARPGHDASLRLPVTQATAARRPLPVALPLPVHWQARATGSTGSGRRVPVPRARPGLGSGSPPPPPADSDSESEGRPVSASGLPLGGPPGGGPRGWGPGGGLPVLVGQRQPAVRRRRHLPVAVRVPPT